MKTFEEDLKPEITPEFIRQCVELAEGLELKDVHVCCDLWYIHIDHLIDDSLLFPLLLHRAVEGWNKSTNWCRDGVVIDSTQVHLWKNGFNYEFEFKDYQPCHLTVCEMAILDCLKEVLK